MFSTPVLTIHVPGLRIMVECQIKHLYVVTGKAASDSAAMTGDEPTCVNLVSQKRFACFVESDP